MRSKPSLRIQELERELATLKMPSSIRDLLPNGKIPELPPGCQWHFFISKHEELAKDAAQVIAQYLESLGFKVCSVLLYLDTSHYISLCLESLGFKVSSLLVC